jgi:histidinol dehydrogenase
MKRSMEDSPTVFEEMFKICLDISKRGDTVTLEHYKKYKEDITRDDLIVKRDEIDKAYDSTSSKLVEKLRFAKENIEKFHIAQREREMWSIEIAPGILAGRIVRPIDIVGCYFTWRRASYPSTVLMTCVPARVAGVKQIIGCTPYYGDPLVRAQISYYDRLGEGLGRRWYTMDAFRAANQAMGRGIRGHDIILMGKIVEKTPL